MLDRIPPFCLIKEIHSSFGQTHQIRRNSNLFVFELWLHYWCFWWCHQKLKTIDEADKCTSPNGHCLCAPDCCHIISWWVYQHVLEFDILLINWPTNSPPLVITILHFHESDLCKQVITFIKRMHGGKWLRSAGNCCVYVLTIASCGGLWLKFSYVEMPPQRIIDFSLMRKYRYTRDTELVDKTVRQSSY